MPISRRISSSAFTGNRCGQSASPGFLDYELLFLDVARARLEVPAQWGFLQRQRAAHPGLRFQAVEGAQSGIGLIQQARLEGSPLRELKADVDKVTRATRLAVSYENGMAYHRDGAPWLAAFEAELLAFPVGRHDDMVDCASYAALEAGTPPSTIYFLDDFDDEDGEGHPPSDPVLDSRTWRPIGEARW